MKFKTPYLNVEFDCCVLIAIRALFLIAEAGSSQVQFETDHVKDLTCIENLFINV
jgi:hypothetical protein